MKKAIKLFKIRLAEWFFNKLQPFEKAVIARKVMIQFGDTPEVKEGFEKRYGIDQVRRNHEQWQNLVNDYGMERVSKIENMSAEAIKRKCMKFSDRFKHDAKIRAIK